MDFLCCAVGHSQPSRLVRTSGFQLLRYGGKRWKIFLLLCCWPLSAVPVDTDEWLSAIETWWEVVEDFLLLLLLATLSRPG